ncbi:MAG: tyrosine-type recombinase/integrase [Coprococcus sp.]
MCYRDEVQNTVRENLDKKLEGFQPFIRRFFSLQKSAKTSNCFFGYIKDMLQWMLDNGRINKKSITDITQDDMKNLTGVDMMDYFDDVLSGKTVRKNSLASLHTKINVFSSFWNYLHKLAKCVDTNIVQDVLKTTKIYNVERKSEKVEIPSYQQLKKFFNNLENRKDDFNSRRDKAIISLLIGSGIRSDELIGLDLSDVHICDNSYIHVIGKGDYSRDVRIIESTSKALENYIRDRRVFLGGAECDALFVSKRKQRISKTALKNIFENYSEGEIYPHELRHYVGSVITNDEKLGITIAKEQLGHASLDTTDKHYTRIMDSIDAITRKYMKEWRIRYGR